MALSNTTSVLPSTDDILRLLDEIRALVSAVEAELRAVEGGDVVELTRAFVALRMVKDAAEDTFKPFNALYEKMKIEGMPQKFEQAGVPTINLDEGYRVTISHLVRATVKSDRKQEAYQWLRDNQLEDIVTETVNASTLSAVAKTLGEENRELDPELFSVAIIPNTSVTKTKPKTGVK